MTFPNKTHDFFGRLLPVEIALGIHGRSGISFIFWPSLSKFHFFSLPRAPGNENKLVARSTNLGPNMCATGPKLKVLPTSARRAMCRQGCPGRLGFTTHNKREATICIWTHNEDPYAWVIPGAEHYIMMSWNLMHQVLTELRFRFSIRICICNCNGHPFSWVITGAEYCDDELEADTSESILS